VWETSVVWNAGSFSSCDFRHLGGVYAIAAQAGSQNVIVENCTFSDCSGGGIKFGQVANCSTGCANAGPSPANSTPGADSGMGNQWWPKPDTPLELQDSNLTVTNCLFLSIPNEFHGANAIFVGYARDVELSHNTIRNTSYSGICIGGGWPKKSSYGRNVKVTYNHIVNAMQLLADGGFIYSTSDGLDSTLGRPQNTMSSCGFKTKVPTLPRQAQDTNAEIKNHDLVCTGSVQSSGRRPCAVRRHLSRWRQCELARHAERDRERQVELHLCTRLVHKYL
jgi:hypothetical protein